MTDVGIVFTNLLYLIVALGVAVIVALVVVLRHRKPKSVEANVASFHRGLRALAPDRPDDAGPAWGGVRNQVVTRATTTPGGASASAPGTPVDPEPVADTEPVADPEPVADSEPVADPEPAADPDGSAAHFAPTKRRPVSPSVNDETGAPTEEAGTG